MLRKLGVEVVMANHGQEALDCLPAESFDAAADGLTEERA